MDYYKISTRQFIWDHAQPVEATNEALAAAVAAAVEDLRAALLDLTPARAEIEPEPEDRGGIMRFSAAVTRLPMRDSAARRWLRAEGLVSDLDGRKVVVWADVVAALRVREAPKPKRRRQPKPTTTPKGAGL